MNAINPVYHTLNDYRLSAEPVYENESSSKLGAGALVIAIFLGVGAYLYYSPQHRSTDTIPASGDMNYQAPAAPDNAARADTMGSALTPGVSDTTATPPIAPSTDANVTRVPAQETSMDRTVTDNKSNVSPAQPAQRARQPAKPVAKSTSETTPSATRDTAIAAPEMAQPAPIVEPQAAAVDQATDTTQDPVVTESVVPAGVAPEAVEGSGG